MSILDSVSDEFKRLGNDAKNAIDSALGQDRKSGASSKNNSVPWEGLRSDSEELAFFRPFNIDAGRWNRLYPYRFLVVDVSDAKNPKIVPGAKVSGGTRQVKSTTTKTQSAQGIEYVLNQEVVSGNWAVNLPITPQQLHITDQYAINTSATMRGIIEEHNGVRFKMITMVGTTGIWPKKPTEGGEIKSVSSLGGLFGGTLEGIGAIASSARGIARAFNGEHPNKPNPALKPDETPDGLFSTGYYQAMYLSQFLERYAMAKRRPENKNWRLVLDIPKQNQSYVVTPLTFTMKQDQQRPNEIQFNLQIKAWKRIDIKEGANAADLDKIDPVDVNSIQKFIDTIAQTRRTLGDASNLIKAVRSDAQGIFNILRQTTLVLKDLGGVAFAVADLPKQIVSDFSSTIEDAENNVTTAFQRPNNVSKDTTGAGGFVSSATTIKQSSSSRRAGQASEALSQKKKKNEGLSSSQVANGALGGNAVSALATDTINQVFDNPDENFDFFDGINVDDLELTPEQQEVVDDEIATTDLVTIDDFREFKKEMLDLALDISNSFGAGDQTYSDIYGREDPRTRPTDMTIEENEILDAIFESIQVYDELTATKEFDDLNIEDPLEYVGGLADETEVNFEDFPSKIPVPVPFGLNIEEIAARYMGDNDKWLEIVTLNRLRSPYIDEEGFFIDFLSNGDDRAFTVFDEEDRLFIGQKILLLSDVVPLFSRKIINLEEISDNNFLVTVDGSANLDNLTTADNARMQGFLPGTVNSQNQIFLPIDAPADPDDRTFEIAGLSDPYLNKISKVDFLLNDNGDLILSSIGEFRLANGLNNMIQALKLKIRIQKGTLLRHLNYGLGLEAGISVADIERGVVIESLNRMVEDDPRFESIDKISLRIDGSTLGIDMSVRIANGTGVLPISVDVPIR